MIRGSSGHVVSMPPILETRKVSRYSTGTWGVKMAHHLERFFPRNNEVKAKISEAAISCFRSYRNAHSSIGFEAPEAESRRSNPETCASHDWFCRLRLATCERTWTAQGEVKRLMCEQHLMRSEAWTAEKRKRCPEIWTKHDIFVESLSCTCIEFFPWDNNVMFWTKLLWKKTF